MFHGQGGRDAAGCILNMFLIGKAVFHTDRHMASPMVRILGRIIPVFPDINLGKKVLAFGLS